jgi:hypothetical protein
LPHSSLVQKRNEVVIWNKIIQNASSAVLELNGVPNDFPLIDHGTGLRNSVVALTLHWDVMPITGLLYQGEGAKTQRIRMPSDYCWEGNKKCSYDVVSKKKGSAGAGTGSGGGGSSSSSGD